MTPHTPHRAFTLIEAVVSLVIIGTLGVASLRAFSAATLTRALAQDRTRGVALARDLLAEITAAPYGEPPTVITGADDRLTFDTVGAYHGWTATPPVSRDGTPLAPVPWRREVTLRSVQIDGATTAVQPSGMLRITVRVYKGPRLVAIEESLRTAAWDTLRSGEGAGG